MDRSQPLIWKFGQKKPPNKLDELVGAFSQLANFLLVFAYFYLPTKLYYASLSLKNIKFGSPARSRTEISQLSIATEYKPAVLPLNYRTIKETFTLGAGGGTRTHTPIQITDFKSVASTYSATPAYQK